MLHTLLSPLIFLSFIKFSSHFLSVTMLHFHTVLLALHRSYKQPLPALVEISYHTATHSTLNFVQPHLFLAISSFTSSTCTHPVTKICKFLYTSLDHIDFLNAPLPLQYSLLIFCRLIFFEALQSQFSIRLIYH